VRNRSPLIHYEVTPEAVGQVIADWTGFGGHMVKDERPPSCRSGKNCKAG